MLRNGGGWADRPHALRGFLRAELVPHLGASSSAPSCSIATRSWTSPPAQRRDGGSVQCECDTLTMAIDATVTLTLVRWSIGVRAVCVCDTRSGRLGRGRSHREQPRR
eukprot:SAG11_NODE_44_length_20765_cov_5.183635_16_plen_108_part_00